MAQAAAANTVLRCSGLGGDEVAGRTGGMTALAETEFPQKSFGTGVLAGPPKRRKSTA